MAKSYCHCLKNSSVLNHLLISSPFFGSGAKLHNGEPPVPRITLEGVTTLKAIF